MSVRTYGCDEKISIFERIESFHRIIAHLVFIALNIASDVFAGTISNTVVGEATPISLQTDDPCCHWGILAISYLRSTKIQMCTNSS